MLDRPLKQNIIVNEWIEKANDDELNAASILKHRDGAPSGVCFLSQQMSEKYLKAFLIQENKECPKIHSLIKLTELCIEIDKGFKTIKDNVIFLNVFYITTRYPGDYPSFSWKDAEEAFQNADEIKNFVLQKIV